MNTKRRDGLGRLSARQRWFGGAAVASFAALAQACIDRPTVRVPQVTQSGYSTEIRNDGIDKVDLLFVVDNSGSMRVNQANIARQLPRMIARLTSPPDANGDGEPDYAPVKDLQVAIISTNLGAPGNGSFASVCGDRGDDGVFNPLRRGAIAMTRVPANEGDRADCPAAGDLPDVLHFVDGETDPATFNRQFRCASLLGTAGCGLEAPLEAVHRALTFHDPRVNAASGSLNRGFLRDDALLAIVMLTDEEDGSARDCRFNSGGACDDALEVYLGVGTRFPEANLDQRFYRYEPGSSEDPTWPLERYVSPRDPNSGWLALKPGHPERVIFAAITGVPLALPTRSEAGETRIEWDRLLGTPGADREDFNARAHRDAVEGTTELGSFSMRANNVPTPDVGHTVPACRRREGGEVYEAYASRRVAEIVRRFDESPLCDGGPCRNGALASVCGEDYEAAIDVVVAKIIARIPPQCLPRRLQQRAGAQPGTRVVECLVREFAPVGQDCNAPGRTQALGAGGEPLVQRLDDGTERLVCDIRQLATDERSNPVAAPDGANDGWFYRVFESGAMCGQNVEFTPQAAVRSGARVRLECIQRVTGAPDDEPVAGGEPSAAPTGP